ncbi:MAG: prolyl oligopeptidase family serine peptidase [Fimbriimonadaceae bacterium]
MLFVAAMVSMQAGFGVPMARRTDFSEVLHGVTVPDPYRWMENLDSPELLTWEHRENEATQDYLSKIPERAWIRKRLETLANYERFGVPELVGRTLLYTRNSGKQNQSPLYVADPRGKHERLLLDPNRLSKTATVALSGTSLSRDGKLLAYSLSSAGSDWQEWRVRKVATGKDLPDKITWSKFSGADWNHNSTGFYYSAFDRPKAGNKFEQANYYQKIYFHRLGTPQSADKLVVQDEAHKDYMFGVSETEDGAYLMLSQGQGTRPENRLFVKPAAKPNSPWKVLFGKFDGAYVPLGNDGSTFYILTDYQAPRKRIIAVNVREGEAAKRHTLVPQAAETIESAVLDGNTFIVTYLKDAHSRVRRFTLAGRKLSDVPLTGIGTVGGFSGPRKNRVTYYDFAGYTMPTTIYRYDVATNRSTVFKRPKVPFDPSLYVTRQVFFPSKDGTRIPMFITAKRGVKLNGENPTILTGYGGFDISITPYFSSTRLQWMEMGGVYAEVNLRGGGEYGMAWYNAGRLKNKQNVFDDFIAAAEYLIAKRYTSTPRLAIEGASNGGLLIGAVETQRPDLFGVCLPHVGVMDMLRFNKFTIGYAWESDYGDPDNAADFKTLLAYSPLQNIKPGTNYPPTLVFTGDHDDRVVPAHSFKFAATMQADQAGPAPILILIQSSAGHGAGKPLGKQLDEIADAYAFCLKNFNYHPSPPK